jgi:hypothetical protein
MPTPRVLLKFSLRLLVLWALLLAKWPGVETGYAAYFRGMGNLAFARFWFWPQATVRFMDPNAVTPGQLPPWADAPKAQDVLDTAMVLENREARGDVSFLRTSSRLIGYLPTAIVIGLFLATPVAWKRRWIGLGAGLAAVHVFILLRITVKLVVGYSGDKGVALFHPGPFWAKFWQNTQQVIHEDPTVSLVVPVFVWIAIAFRPSQWGVLQDAAQPPPAELKSGVRKPKGKAR